MKLPDLKSVKWNYKALAFVFPFVGILLVMLASGYTPFGHYSMLYSDMYHQYYPFFKAFRQTLLSGKSLLYSWNVGLGMDYLGLAAYYLASPLNLLSVLVPEKLLLVYFSLLVPIKLGLASLFFSIFLNGIFKKNDFSITIFGCCYGLCAWALGYQWNVMWLDTFALLPLVALGTVSLLRDKKFILYTLTLFLSVFSNYYIGFFTCIFVALVFFCYEICRFRGFGRFFADLGRIALFSALAIGMTAILELPALAALQTTQSSANNFPTGFKLNIASENTWLGLLDAMRQVAGNMCGGLEPSFKEGLPNLYCSMGAVMLAFLYLTGRGIRLRDKLCSVFLLLFFMISFIIRQLDYIWHGFHFTNMIPYRFSFLFSFVLLYMAYKAWLIRRRFRLWQVILAGILAVGLVLCSDSRWEPVFLIYNLGMLVLYLIAGIYGCYRKKLPADAQREAVLAARAALLNRRRTAVKLLSCILALEMVLNVINFGICFPGTSITDYPKGTTYTASMIRYMKEREEDTPFYRAETTRAQILNDGALNNYNGISTFTSSANVSVTKFMKALGYGAKETYNRYCYEQGSPVTDLFLNLKYLIERNGTPLDTPYYTDLHSYGDVHLLESNIYLPLGFLAEPSLAEVDFEDSNRDFHFQNTLFRAATGLKQNVWDMNSAYDSELTSSNVEIKTQNSAGQCSYVVGDLSGTISYNYTIRQSGYMCVQLKFPSNRHFAVLRNGIELYSDDYSLPQITAVGSVEAGDTVEIRVNCSKEEDNQLTVKAAILNDSLFRMGYDILAASTLELSSFSDTKLEGSIVCNRDGLLYTSIPQNGNWYATVDGEPAEITLIGDAMIGLKLTEGTHTIRFTYYNEAFSLGWKISLGCALVFAAIALVVYQPRKRKGKYER